MEDGSSSYVEMGRHEAAAKSSEDDDIDDDPSSSTGLLPTRGALRQARAFYYMAAPYFGEQATARGLLAGILVLLLLHSGVRVLFSYLARDFWTALGDDGGDPDEFYRVLRQFLIALVLLAPVTVLYRYQRQKLAIHWRGWMTERVLALYARHPDVYYGLERATTTTTTTESMPDDVNATTTQSTAPSSARETKRPPLFGRARAAAATTPRVGVDNPDQRMTEDVRSFTVFSLTLFLTVLTATLDLCCFSVVLATILPRLFLAIVLFAGTGTLATVLIGRVLIQLNYDRLQLEAHLRFALVRFREHAEQIAFLGGHAVETRRVRGRLTRVLENMTDLNAATRNLEVFTTYYGYLTWILPIAVIAPSYFAGDVELGVLQQAAASFSHVLEDLSLLITRWDDLSEFSAGIDRLYTFLQAMQALDPQRRRDGGGTADGGDKDDATRKASLGRSIMDLPDVVDTTAQNETASSSLHSPTTIHLQRHVEPSTMHDHHPPALILRNLTLTTPVSQRQERVLFANVNLRVAWGEHLLITGASGVGKSSLLRAMAGLWKTGSGTIQRPADEVMYFLPQKPYCCVGTLRDQLSYPRVTSGGDDVAADDHDPTGESQGQSLGPYTDDDIQSDADLREILRAVDLADLSERAAAAVSHCTNGLDAVMDWSNILSLGEQQRLSFGRVLVNRPRFVILDESTSALDVESEARMYRLLQTGGVTYVSVGHRPTLFAHHDTKLILRKDEPCTVEPIRQRHS